MTKNLINPLKPPSMADELDLDSLLRRHNAAVDSTSSSSPSSDNDDDRRRVDDLLNNSDHDSDDNDVVSVRTDSQTLISTSKSSNYDQLKYNLIQRFKSDEYSGYTSRKPSNSRPASVFGGGYRATGKPGAALAAAAAASRSIKSRRALSLSLVGKVSDGDGLCDVSERAESVSGQVEVKLTSNGGGDGGSGVMDVCETVVECSEGGEDVSRSDSFAEIGNVVEEMGETSLSLVLDDVERGNVVEDALSKFEDVGTSNELDESEKEKIVFNDSENVELSNDVNESEKEKSVFEDTGDFETSNDAEKSENEESVRTMLGNAEKIDGDGDGDGDDRFGIEKDVDSSSGTDDVRELVAELVEDKTGELHGDSASTEEKLQAKKTPLEVAEELEKKQASTGQDWEEGAAAQPMRLEGARKGSTVLGYFDVNADNAISRAIKSQAFKRDYGRPQVLAVHLNYIALGMSRGVIIVVPSKYSVQHGDRMDSKMLMLGVQGDRSHIPVTSICFDQLGDLLLAGYGDGQIIFWNLPRGTLAKVVPGEHKAAVVHALFLGQDSQANRQYKAVTGDSKGLLLLHEISVVTLFGFQINKTQCLLDGQRTGTVLCASPLLPDQITGGASTSVPGNTTGSTSSLGGVMGGVVGGATGWKLFAEGSSLSEEGVVIFATHQNALVVRLRPGLEVYANFVKPKGVREGAMPYTSWKCTTQSHGSSTENLSHEALEKISLLAIAWDQKVQVAKLVKSKLTFLGNWTLESAAVGLAWLDDQMLVILTLSGQLCLYARDGTLIHQTSYDINGTGGDDMIAYHTYFTNVFGNPEKAYQNSLAVRGASIYVLAPTHLVISRLLLWRERIQVLRDAGDWMGAFNMAMTLYDGQAHGVIDLPRSLDAIQETLAPYLVELLISYVDEVFSYISVAFSNHNVEEEQVDGATGNSSSSNIKEQFTRVGGVAVEFCVHIKRTDILFDEIFSRFVAVHQRDTFLELLEPYILKDMLGSLPPEVMQALVEHYNCKGWLQRVEQCVLHMDISSLDFNQVVRLCRENGLYGALIYLFNKGLDDYKTPLEELLSVLKNHERDSASVGYRMLVYLKYCFSGLAFPPGHGTISRQRLPSLRSLRSELVQFLLEDFGRPKSQSGSSVSFSGAYLNLYYLLELDTEATLDVLRIAFVEDGNFEPHVVVDDPTVSDRDRVPENKNIMVQKTVDGLVLVLDVNISQTVRSGNSDTSMGLWPSKKDIGQIIEFIASYIATKRASVSKSVMSQILEYLMSENYVFLSSSEQMSESKKRREKKVLALLDAVPPTEWNASFVLHLSEQAQFYQVCGLIHATRCDYLAALDSYMKDVDEPVYAFSFIDGMLLKLSETDSLVFRSAVISRIPELVILSREGTYFLARSYFNKEINRILSQLQSNPGSLFLYLKTLFEVHLSGTLNFSSIYVDNVLDCPWGRQKKSEKSCLEAYLERVYEFPKFIRDNPVEVSDDMIELYLEMLCKYEPDSVLKFLETSESYRVDRCLQLCQEYGIVDAAAFLLERVGDVGSALLLVLSNLNDKFMMLDSAVGNLIPSKEDKIGHIDLLPAALRLEEVQGVERILRACIGLCQRNTPRLESDEAESLWFHMLDTFCKPLLISQGNSEIGMFAQSSSFKKVSEADEITWRISGSQRYAPLLKRLFSQFIKEIVEGMIGYVRLPSIMSKLLTDNGGQEFGDFKPTILGMLGTYSFEMRILDTAKCLIEDDTFYTMSALRKGASKGYSPRSLLCCICNTSFSKSRSSSGIRMFSCGHAIHLQCELQESGTSSQRSSHVCPVCVIKKRSHKAKGKVVEQGLVSTSSYTSWRPQGTATLHSHDLDAFENLTSSHPISRFEMLNSLQKKSATQTDTMPQLKLAPPAVYHDKVNKRNHFPGGSSEASEKPSKNKHLRDLKAKGSSIRFPLKSKIFGKEKTRVQ